MKNAASKITEMIDEKKVLQSQFDYNLQIIYSATLLSGNPSEILRFVSNYPVYTKNGDEDAVINALNDLKLAMSYGKGALDYLLERNHPIHENGFLVLPSLLPFLGRITHLFLTNIEIYQFLVNSPAFIIFLLLSFIHFKNTKGSFQRSSSHYAFVGHAGFRRPPCLHCFDIGT